MKNGIGVASLSHQVLVLPTQEISPPSWRNQSLSLSPFLSSKRRSYLRSKEPLNRPYVCTWLSTNPMVNMNGNLWYANTCVIPSWSMLNMHHSKGYETCPSKWDVVGFIHTTSLNTLFFFLSYTYIGFLTLIPSQISYKLNPPRWKMLLMFSPSTRVGASITDHLRDSLQDPEKYEVVQIFPRVGR